MITKYFNKFFGTSIGLGAKEKSIASQKSYSSITFDSGLFRSSCSSPSAEYCNNVIVYKCVNIISQAASHIPWVIYDATSGRNKKMIDHPLYKILKKPNPLQAGAEFFTELIASKLLYGNSYIAGLGEKKINSLYLLHPTKVQIKYENGILSHYIYANNNKSIKFEVKGNKSASQILHIRSFNPSDDMRGVSCLEAARKSIDIHNATSEWNANLLRNGARPTGAIIMRDSSQYLSEDQFLRLKDQLYEKFAGTSNAGKPLLLEGGLDWRDMSINPKDMDFIESKNSAAREIALAFGLPPQLLGITGDNTYSNMQEARLALWEETVIPLLDRLADSMSSWFSDLYERELLIDFDRDFISAISDKRQNLWEKLNKADFMTLNEKRAIVGLPPLTNGDQI
ncbi:MAG: phage portal protein [Rickettsiaceae bacterium]|nr:phage portal protein [Rickettsiaceae bacterium]